MHLCHCFYLQYQRRLQTSNIVSNVSLHVYWHTTCMLKSNNVPTNAHKATGDSILKTNLAVKCIFDKLQFIKNETTSWKLTCLELC